MNIRVFETNERGRIEFTRCELEKLLNETYNDGYAQGSKVVSNTIEWSPVLTEHTMPVLYSTDTTNITGTTVPTLNPTTNEVTIESKAKEDKLKADDIINIVEDILNNFDPKVFYGTARALPKKNDVFSNLQKELSNL